MSFDKISFSYRLEQPPFPWPETLQSDRTVGYSSDGLDVVAYPLEHASDLAVLTLSNDDVHRCHQRSAVEIHDLHDAGPRTKHCTRVAERNVRPSDLGEQTAKSALLSSDFFFCPFSTMNTNCY